MPLSTIHVIPARGGLNGPAPEALETSASGWGGRGRDFQIYPKLGLTGSWKTMTALSTCPLWF